MNPQSSSEADLEHVVPPLFESNPLLPLSQELPITMNAKNRQILVQNIPAEALRNMEILQQSTPPWLSLGLLIFGTLLLALARRLFLKARSRPPTPEEEAATARQKALQSLNALLKRKSTPERFYIELTDTVRQYVEERYHLHAPMQTTQEFLQMATIHPIFDPITRMKLKNFLINADNVKFARHHPSNEECLDAQRAAESVIEEENALPQQKATGHSP